MFHAKHRVSYGTFAPPPLSDEARAALEASGVRIRRQRADKRPYIAAQGKLCSKCHLAPPEPGQRYCKACRNAAMRATRAKQKRELAAMRAALAAHGIAIEDAP